jgi:hypothetical protein
VQKQRRGCKRPGEDYEMTGTPFAYTSPMLHDIGEPMLTECPVGHVLRETPHIYDVMERCRFAENMTPRDAAMISPYMQQMIRLFDSECARLRELDEKSRTSAADARAAASALKRGR